MSTPCTAHIQRTTVRASLAKWRIFLELLGHGDDPVGPRFKMERLAISLRLDLPLACDPHLSA